VTILEEIFHAFRGPLISRAEIIPPSTSNPFLEPSSAKIARRKAGLNHQDAHRHIQKCGVKQGRHYAFFLRLYRAGRSWRSRISNYMASGNSSVSNIDKIYKSFPSSPEVMQF
jgi:hypothetical protein